MTLAVQTFVDYIGHPRSVSEALEVKEITTPAMPIQKSGFPVVTTTSVSADVTVSGTVHGGFLTLVYILHY